MVRPYRKVALQSTVAIGSLCLAAVILAARAEPQATTKPRLDRFNLLEFRDESGEPRAVSSPQEWEERRAEIVAGMESVMGKFPEDRSRATPAVEVKEEADVGSYVRRLIAYQSEPNSVTPAYLCIPKSALAGSPQAKPVPAVLCLHPTDNKVGHKVVVGLGGRAGRQYAAELAELGFVTLSPAYPLLADYQPDLKKLGYESGTMKAIWDNSRALDLLASLDFIDDSNGFGVIGHSLGGHNAIFTAVFDRRITVLVSSCGFDSFLDYYDGAEQNWRAEKGWCQTRYMLKLATYRGRLDQIPFDFPELVGALAPRRVFISAPKHDSNFRWKSVERCTAAARPVFRLLGSPDQLTVRFPDCDHNFPEEIRKQSYRVIKSVLRRSQP